jgi:hypothetical protein
MKSSFVGVLAITIWWIPASEASVNPSARLDLTRGVVALVDVTIGRTITGTLLIERMNR